MTNFKCKITKNITKKLVLEEVGVYFSFKTLQFKFRIVRKNYN